ncbi:MAG: C4-dicarboxylate ABC transporter [Desulfobulbaceae bacterium A2]|nr:MAG: C4-dicarboxylate ABC transporter [Desulfobulbaceae bacterium A2]
MKRIAQAIDWLNERVGRITIWLVLLSVLISSGNALSRYLFNYSTNGMLEIQWYLFSMIFLLCAGYTLKHDGHVRIDVIYGRLSKRGKAVINILGGLLFLLPVCVIITKMSWATFMTSLRINEGSPDIGGLLRWPIKLLIPVGFFLLGLQGISQIIKEIIIFRDPKSVTIPREAHDEKVA